MHRPRLNSLRRRLVLRLDHYRFHVSFLMPPETGNPLGAPPTGEWAGTHRGERIARGTGQMLGQKSEPPHIYFLAAALPPCPLRPPLALCCLPRCGHQGGGHQHD